MSLESSMMGCCGRADHIILHVLELTIEPTETLREITTSMYHRL